jgi:hypothetical protein
MVQEAKSPVKNLVIQRCAEGFNSGVKGLIKQKTPLDTKFIYIYAIREFTAFVRSAA